MSTSIIISIIEKVNRAKQHCSAADSCVGICRYTWPLNDLLLLAGYFGSYFGRFRPPLSSDEVGPYAGFQRDFLFEIGNVLFNCDTEYAILPGS